MVVLPSLYRNLLNRASDCCALLVKKGERLSYLRFLKSWTPSIVVTYWKPVSISAIASFVLAAALTMNSSSASCSIK